MGESRSATFRRLSSDARTSNRRCSHAWPKPDYGRPSQCHMLKRKAWPMPDNEKLRYMPRWEPAAASPQQLCCHSRALVDFFLLPTSPPRLPWFFSQLLPTQCGGSSFVEFGWHKHMLPVCTSSSSIIQGLAAMHSVVFLFLCRRLWSHWPTFQNAHLSHHRQLRSH